MSQSPMLSAPRRRFATLLALSALSLAVAGVVASSAQACASPCHWFSGGLAIEWANASTEAHSINYIQGNANHNEFCIGAETGSAGNYKDSSQSDCQVYSSGNFAASASYEGTCCFHATIVNVGPLSSITVSTATHYDY